MSEQPVPATENASNPIPETPAPPPPVETPAKPPLTSVTDNKGNGSGPTLDMLLDVNLQLTVELGSTQMTVRQVLDLQKGAVIELNRIAGDAVDIYVNDRMLAKGEVVVVDDKFGVRITELVATEQEIGEE